jgi:choline dehydrogenase-like flavoprotein
VFPTSTGYGPTLTIVALAIRACRALAGASPTEHAPGGPRS